MILVDSLLRGGKKRGAATAPPVANVVFLVVK